MESSFQLMIAYDMGIILLYAHIKKQVFLFFK